MLKETVIITSPDELESLEMILNEYQMHDMFNIESFLNLGYKNVPSNAKDTYRLIRNLYRLRSKKDQDKIDLSLNYLAVAFNTSEECQSERIKALEKAKLLIVERKAYNISSFIVIDPLPDTTFVETATRLIQRKKLGLLIAKYKSTKNVGDQQLILQDIELLVKQGISHHRLSSIKHLLNR